MFIKQQAHQLGDRQHRMGVVQVDADLGRQVAEVLMGLAVAAQQILHAGADEEIFLVQAQLAPGGRGVVRVQHTADILRVVFALHSRKIIAPVESAEIDFVGGLGRPQAQGVGGLRVVAGDDGVVGHGLYLIGADPLVKPFFFHHVTAELHPVHHFGAGKFPWVALRQPIVGNLDLPSVHNGLAEHAVVVADTVTKARDIQRSHGVQKTGRQPPQAAVAQSRIRLQLTDGRHIHAKVQQRLPHPGTQAQCQQGVAKSAPHQKFHGQVIHPLGILGVLGAGGFHPALNQLVTHSEGCGVEPILGAGGLRVLAHAEHQLVGDGAFERLQIPLGAVEWKCGHGGDGIK